MSYNKRLDQIAKDVRGKVLNHVYVPKTIRDNYSTIVDKDNVKINIEKKIY